MIYLDASRLSLPPPVEFEMELYRLSKPKWIAYSSFLKRNLIVPAIETDSYWTVNCLDIKRLFFMKASKNSIMIIWPEKLELLIRFYELDSCGMTTKTMPWYWKFEPNLYKSNKEATKYAAVLIDNSVTWKQTIFDTLQELLAFRLIGKSMLKDNEVFRRHSIHINPYRIDQQGFEDTILTLSHLHQTMIIVLVGIGISFTVFTDELFIKVYKNTKREPTAKDIKNTKKPGDLKQRSGKTMYFILLFKILGNICIFFFSDLKIQKD